MDTIQEDDDVETEEPDPERGRKTAPDADLERVIEKISTEHSFDIRGYRRSTLYRRLRKRMADAGCDSVEDYLVRMESDRNEYPQLIDTVLINVTRLFRDPEAWEFLQGQCLAPLLRHKAAGEPVRAWSAGCATGEEAYTLGMCIAELLGEEGMHDVKIYATDFDDAALSTARVGIYSPQAVQHLSRDRLERFFEELPRGGYRVRRELRSAVIFGRHNVLNDPPISRLDVLCCRNLLIYFDTETQHGLLARYHYALRNDGFLFLGKAETLMTRSSLYRAVEPRFRIFQRNPGNGNQGLSQLNEQLNSKKNGQDSAALSPNYLLQSFLNASMDPLLLLDVSGRICMVSPRANEIFHVTSALIGRNFLEMEERFRPLGMRLAIEEVRATARRVQVDELQVPSQDGAPTYLTMEVQPIMDPWGALSRILLWGHDVTRERQLATELDKVKHDLETTNEELQCTNEELETANEELQCTNEELETTNEELQSTNEELETTIEELQSTNEELETANDELRSRQDELNSVGRYQEIVLSALHMGLIVLDRNLVVTSWNKASESTWGLRENETVGHDLLKLDTGLPTQLLREPLRRLIQGTSPQETLVLDATNRRGRPVRCHIRLNPLLDPGGEVAGAMVLIDEEKQQTDGGPDKQRGDRE